MPTRPAVGPILKADARNRALRTLLVALAVSVFVDVWPLVSDALNGADPVRWAELGKALLRVALLSAGSFLLRRFADPSALPSPLPADD